MRPRAALDASPRCLADELSHCTEEPRSLILRIEWESSEGHMNGCRKSAELGPFLPAFRPFIGQSREMRHYAPTSAVAPK